MSQLTDEEISVQLRDMGQDIGPINAATRHVYKRKLERLLLEQSNLSSSVCDESLSKDVTKHEQPSEVERSSANNVAQENVECGDVVEGSLRLEEEEEEEEEEDDDQYQEELIKRENEAIRSVVWESVASDKGKAFTDYNDAGKDQNRSNRHSYSGFLPSPLAPPSPLKSLNGARANVNCNQLRQRSATFDVGCDPNSFDRVDLTQEDCVPSPRSPLSTYLIRAPNAAKSLRQLTSAAALKPAQPARLGGVSRQSLLLMAVIASVVLVILGLAVVLNMDSGYASPV